MPPPIGAGEPRSSRPHSSGLRSALASRLVLTLTGATLLAVLLLLGVFASSPASPGAEAPASATPPAPAPFDPPSLEELAKVRWVPRQVAELLALLEEEQRKAPPPPTDEEAVLSVENSSDEANARIVAVLGRLPRTDSEVDWDATLNRFLFGKPSTLNPLFYSSRYDADVINVLYVGPFIFDRSLTMFGDAEVVREWSISEDSRMSKVVLRDDLTWSDGTPFTAHDVEFTFETLKSPHIKIPAVSTNVEKLLGVKAYDDRTVVYFHRKALATHAFDQTFPIIPRHVFSRTLAADPTMEKSEEHLRLRFKAPVTNGPYRLVNWDAERGEILMERREDWHRKDGKAIRRRPFLKNIRLKIIQDRTAAALAFQKGELDEMELNPDQWNKAGGPGGARVRGEEWTYGFFAWNQRPIPDNPYFKDARVREAMTLAFPHAELLKDICQGLYRPAVGIHHPSSWMADAQLKPAQQDLRRANDLLKQAGWTDSDGDGVLDRTIDGKQVKFSFTLNIAAGTLLGAQVAELLKRELQKLGVECQVSTLEAATFMNQMFEHKFQAATFLWGTAVDPDLSRNIFTTKAYEDKKKGRNYVGYSSLEVDRLFEDGMRELDREKRAAIYRQIQSRILQDHVYSLLYYRSSLYAVSRDVRGFNFSPRGPFNYNPGVFSLWKRKR